MHDIDFTRAFTFTFSLGLNFFLVQNELLCAFPGPELKLHSTDVETSSKTENKRKYYCAAGQNPPTFVFMNFIL